MCELLALSTSHPTQLNFSLHTLAAHGGEGSSTRDGWGVAFYQGRDVALFREPSAAGNSALVQFLETRGPPTTLAISHIRHATRGSVSFANTQPFMRELGGRTHVFAHNGDLPGIEQSGSLVPGAHRAIGQTDSEHAFCALLGRMAVLWGGPTPPPLDGRRAAVAAFAAELRALGPANFLYADGDVLFAHGHRRKHSGSPRAEPPGLWMVQQHCVGSEPAPDCGAGVSMSGGERLSLLIASVPLTDAAWRPFAEGELLVVRDGQVLG